MDELARGVLRVTADASELKAGLADASTATKAWEAGATAAARNVGKAVEGAAQKTNAALQQMTQEQKRFLSSTERTSLLATMPRSEFAAFRAGQLGIPLEDPRLKESINRFKQAETQSMRLEKTTKELAAAYRLLPAQMTDVVTSLISGQPAYLVAIQQGGQLKDSFGGIIPMLKALGGLFTPVRLALGGVGAVLGIVAYGFFAGVKEIENFNQALVMTGRIAGFSVDQLQRLSKEVAGRTGATQGAAAEAVTALVGAGNIDTSGFDRFAEAAVRANRTIGMSVEDVAKQFAALGKEPVKESLKLNESLNYLTASVFRQIQAMEENGNKAGAAALAQKAYADAINSRTSEIEANLNRIGRAWIWIKDQTKGAIDALKNIGRIDTLEEQIAAQEKLVRILRDRPQSAAVAGGFGSNPAAILANAEQQLDSLREQQRLQQRATAGAADFARAQKAGVEATAEIKRIIDLVAPKAEKLGDTLAKYRQYVKDQRAAGIEVTDAEVRKREAQIREHFREKGGKSTTNDEATRMLLQAKETAATLRLQIEYGQQISENERRLIEFNALIGELKEKKILTADEKSLLNNQEKVRAALELNAALEKEAGMQKFLFDLEAKRTEQMQQNARAIDAMVIQMEEVNRNRREGYERTLLGMGSGDFNRSMIQEQNSLIREFDRQYAQVAKLNATGLLGSDKYQEARDEIKRQLDIALADHARYYENLRKLQQDANVGINEALNNYLDRLSNISQSAADIVSGSFQRMEDSLVNFVRTGKLDIKSLTDFIINEINRLIIRKHVLGPIAESFGATPSSTSTAFGIFRTFLGSLGVGGSAIGYGSAGTAAATAMVSNGMGGFVPALAAGGVFSPRGMEAFASGGVVDRATPFRFGRSSTGVMGEAGYEGILPLTRTSSGKLGVTMVGKTEPSVTHINFTVQASDARSFLQSEGQINALLARAAARGKRNL